MSSATAISTRQIAHSASIGISAIGAKLPLIVWIYLFAVVVPLGFNVGSLSMSLLRLLLLVTTIPLTFNLFSGRYGKVIPADYLFYLHVFWQTVALGVNNPDRVVENVGSNAVEFLGGYVLARAFIRTPEAFAGLTRALLIIVICTIPLALVESQTDTALIPQLIESLPGLTSFAQVEVEARMGLERSQVVFAHPIHYGLFCSIATSLVFVGLKGSMSLRNRILATAAVSFGVFLSLSSGALLALLLQFGLISWAYIFRKVRNRWWLLVALFVSAYVVVDLLSNRTPIKVLMSYATFSAHTAYYRSIIFEWGMKNVWDNPIFGLGLRYWIRPSYMKSGTVDNFWLLMAMRYGIPGFLLILIGYFDAIYRVGRRKLTPGTALYQLRLGWMFTFLGVSFTLVTVHVWTSVYSFVFFMLGAGIWMATTSDTGAQEGSGAAPATPAPRAQDRPVRARGAVGQNVVATAAKAPQTDDTPSATPAPSDREALAFTRFKAGEKPEPPGNTRGGKR